MVDDKNDAPVKLAEDGIDYSGRPFGYIAPEGETAMVCEQDPVVRDRIIHDLKKMGFEIAQPASFREALKFMRFHVFNLIVVDEDFDTGVWETNNVLRYLEGLDMSVRRQSFVALISATLATMDSINAYNKSVNLTINKRDVAGMDQILRQAMAEYEDFYHVYHEYLRG
ncbi:MAG: response regulator [Smithellaceae bacterium]